jgi:hypothetical protein
VRFKRLLLRFERIQQRHYGMKLLAYPLMNLRAFAAPKTRNQLLYNTTRGTEYLISRGVCVLSEIEQ